MERNSSESLGNGGSPLLGDLNGGMLAGVMALPGILAYGLLVYSPLGPEAAVKGMSAALSCFVVLNLLSTLFGRSKTLISGPTSLPTMVMVAAVAAFQADGRFSTDQILDLMVLTACTAGIVQFLLGWAGLGLIIKYIPYNVRSGLLTGTGIIIVWNQIRYSWQELSVRPGIISLGQRSSSPE